MEDSCWEKALLLTSGWEVEFLAHDPALGIIAAYCQIQEARDTPGCFQEESRGFPLGRRWKFCHLFASPSELIAQVLFASFSSLALIAACQILTVPVVRTYVMRLAGVFVRGQVAPLLVLTFEGAPVVALLIPPIARNKNGSLMQMWMREEGKPAKILIHCQSL